MLAGVLFAMSTYEFKQANSHEETVENFKTLIHELNRLIVDFREKSYYDYKSNSFYMVYLSGESKNKYIKLAGCGGGYIGLGLHGCVSSDLRSITNLEKPFSIVPVQVPELESR